MKSSKQAKKKKKRERLCKANTVKKPERMVFLLSPTQTWEGAGRKIKLVTGRVIL